jgi:hypothetical protein
MTEQLFWQGRADLPLIQQPSWDMMLEEDSMVLAGRTYICNIDQKIQHTNYANSNRGPDWHLLPRSANLAKHLNTSQSSVSKDSEWEVHIIGLVEPAPREYDGKKRLRKAI